MRNKQSAYRIVIITGGETNHKYFRDKINEKYNVACVFKLYSGLNNEEYFNSTYQDCSEHNKEIINTFTKLRIEAQEELLLPDGNDFKTCMHLKK